MADFTINQKTEQTTVLATDSFPMQTAAGVTMRATASDILTYILANTWYQELNRQTLGAAADSIGVTVTAKKYLYVIVALQGTGGTISGQMLFNSDAGTNYAVRLSLNGAAETTNVSQSSVLITGAATYANLMFTAEIINIAAQEKLVSGRRWDPGTAGAANLPNRAEFLGKWANTTNPITNVSLTNSGSGDFAAGSELIVLGHD